MTPFNFPSFHLRDILTKAIPGFILQISLIYMLGSQSLISELLQEANYLILVTVVCLPVGVVIEQVALSVRQIFFGRTSFLSEEKLIRRFLHTTPEGFWIEYLRLLSSGNAPLIALIERYNQTRFFFLNLNISMVSISVSLTSLLVSHMVLAPMTLGPLLISAATFRFHVKWQQGFYFIVGTALTISTPLPKQSQKA